MSRRAKLLGLVGLVASLAVIAIPAQAAAPIATQVQFGGSGGLGDDQYWIRGTITSPNPKCVAGRTVKLYGVLPGDARVLQDIDKISKNGRYTVIADFSEAESIIIKALRRKIGGPKHHRICAAAQINLS